jgi:amino acid transporter
MSDSTAPNQLRKNSLGVASITFLVISAAAPLTAVAGGVPIAMLLGNGSGVAAGFGIVTVILLAFAVGYVAMARHIANAGAFYAFTAQGLGGRMGGAASMIAILSYNAMQVGVMGLLGAASAQTFGQFGIVMPWWVWSLATITVVGILGYRQVDLSVKILMVLVLLEYLIVMVIDGAIFLKGGDSGLSIAPFTPAQFLSGSPFIGILFCFAAFIGFEATTIFSEEARNPEKTVPRATFLSVVLIGTFYLLTSWLMANGAGVEKLVPTLQGLSDPTSFLFDLAGRYVGGTVPAIMSILFVTSLFAGVLAFHSAAARYMYVAGREGILPDGVGVTHAQHQSPHIGSVIQTIISFAVISYFAVMGLDPVLHLFTLMTQLGTLGILGLMAVTSFAIMRFFSKAGGLGESSLATTILPALTGVVMALLFVIIFAKFGEMTGATGLAGVALPLSVVVIAAIGYILGIRLERRDPARFARMGCDRT